MRNSTRLTGILLAGATLLLGAAAPAAPREYEVFQTDHPPVIDGDLRDDIWRAVPWSGDFTGLQGARADVDTQFAMAWDKQFLYVAVRCKEPHPDAVHADVAGRDPRIVNDDHIEILLAQSDKPAAFFRIFINAGRGRMDQWIEEGRPADPPQPAAHRSALEKAGLDSAAQVQAGEWTVAAAIPLPKVKFPLKEGVTYAGNICRVRPAGAVKEMAWSPAQRDLHTSADFGLFKLSGPAPKPRPIRTGDAICMRNGEVINGSVLRMADGKIHFTSPTFAEEVSFSAAEVLRLDLAWTEAEAAPEQFFLSNGAEVCGKLVSLSAETLGIESPSLGRISIPRRLLANLCFGGSSIESHFDTGLIAPWESLRGDCSFSDGLLHLTGEGAGGQNQAVLSLPLRQDRPVTLVAEYDPPAGFSAVRLQIFANRAHPQMQIQSGVMLNVAPTMATLSITKDGQAVPGGGGTRRRLPPVSEHARIKLTYNPATGVAKAWCNGKQVGEATAPEGPKQGEFVVFGTTRPLTVRSLTVYNGIPAPDDPMAAPKSGEIVAALSNGDALHASQVEFRDGNFVFTTEFGQPKLSPERVISIAFPYKASKPAAVEDLAWIETGGSRFPLQVTAITAESVLGKSADFGEVKLPRRIVRSITFPAP